MLTGEAVVMPSRTPIDYARPTAPMGALALWTLQPLAWMAQGATRSVGMLGLSALSAPPCRALRRSKYARRRLVGLTAVLD